MKSDLIANFEEIDKEDTLLVGGKGANLGEMAKIKLPIPPGFIVTAQAYKLFLAENNLEKKFRTILADLNVENPLALEEASQKIKKLIITSKVPEQLASEIISSYLRLSKALKGKSKLRNILSLNRSEPLVAIRSSATSEDSKTASFAGQNETFLNISGEANVVEAVRKCWASLFDGRSIFYRVQNKIDHFTSYIAVIIQLMVQSEVSGVLFSIDPVTNNKNRIVAEAVWGLGEYIVQGKVTPDHYELNKSDLMIVEKRVTPQKIMLKRASSGRTIETKVSAKKQVAAKLTDSEIQSLGQLAIELEKHYFFPQDSEFAVSSGQIFLVQTRPVTTTQNFAKREEKEVEKEISKMSDILEGAPASPGIKSGPVKVLHSAKEIGRVEPGDVLVATQTNPDYVPAMKKSVAIVTDMGGRTSHAAIVSRELGIPCVVGTQKATRILKDGEIITVNGTEGKIYKGGLNLKIKENIATQTKAPQEEKMPIKTATKVYVNLAEPEKAKLVAAQNCDGIGLLRAEFVLAQIGLHPKKAIADKRQKQFTQTLADNLATFAESFYPRPVVYRTTDFKTNEYRTLKGGEKYEPDEENPMIGFRGAFRYISQPDVFKMEIEAIKIVREEKKLKNLWLMIPFCRTVSELRKVKALISDFGLIRSLTFKIWLMCEIPSNVILLNKFIEVGIDGISVGSNDLTMLTLGVDRDNENVAGEFDERNEAMLFSFYKIIKTCQRYNVTCSMCGQAPSDYPDLTEKLVKWGISSVSVSPDAIDHTREIVYQSEKKLANR